MTTKQYKDLTNRIFESIEAATTIHEIDALISGELVKNKMDYRSYPYLHFSLTAEEIKSLTDKGILDQEGNLPQDFSKRDDLDPLIRLLYSVLWKNGDLKKIKHIVEGVKNSEEEETKKEDGLVFYQFGKFLTKTGQPIIDQHVLRAFAIYKDKDENEVERLRRKDSVNKSDRKLIQEYKDWLRSDIKPELRDEKDYTYHIDQVLFALGKTIKLGKK